MIHMILNNHNAHTTVTNYLSSLVWDGTPRIDRWLIDCAGADNTPQVREASRKMLIAAVRRARHPGCQLDQVIVLEGPQGCGKSNMLRVLAVKDTWFTNEFSLSPQGLVEATEGKWIVELPNILQSNIAALKVCLSRSHDMYRKPHDHKATQAPRQFVVIGTVSSFYLRDPTNNRRFRPISIRSVDLKKLQSARDQLWAEAATAEALGESIHLETAPAQEIGLSETPDPGRRPLVKA